jgi:hypothetical protein
MRAIVMIVLTKGWPVKSSHTQKLQDGGAAVAILTKEIRLPSAPVADHGDQSPQGQQFGFGQPAPFRERLGSCSEVQRFRVKLRQQRFIEGLVRCQSILSEVIAIRREDSRDEYHSEAQYGGTDADLKRLRRRCYPAVVARAAANITVPCAGR